MTIANSKVKVTELQPGVLLFEPTHQERVLDAMKEHSKAHSGDKRRKGVSGHKQAQDNAVERQCVRRNGIQ